jgi:hypothetical protein
MGLEIASKAQVDISIILTRKKRNEPRYEYHRCAAYRKDRRHEADWES